MSVSLFCSFQNSEKGVQIHERKALNTEFYINICMYSPTEIGMDDVIPFHCLLKMYLENDSNNCRVEYSKMNVLSTMNITERAGLFVQYKAKLVAKYIFMSLTYMMDLLPHINNLNVSYQMSVMDSNDNDIKSRLSLSTRHTGESCLSKADTMQLLFFNGFRPTHSEDICKGYSESAAPRIQCTHIGIDVISQANYARVTWNCTDPISRERQKAGQQTTHISKFVLEVLALFVIWDIVL